MDIYKLYTDGSHIPGFDTAGYGGLIYKNDKVFHRFSGTTKTDLHFHEIVALYEGLKIAKELGIDSLDCVGDCIKVMQVCNTPDKALRANYFQNSESFSKLNELIETFEHVSFKWTPRKHNKAADYLAGKYKKDVHIDEFFAQKNKDKKIFSMEKGDIAKKNSSGKRIVPEANIHFRFQVKPTHTDKKHALEVIVWQLLDSKVNKQSYYIEDGIKPIIELMCQCFHQHEGKLSFSLDGLLCERILNTIKGQTPISKANRSSFNHLQEALNSYERWSIYTSPLTQEAQKHESKTVFTEDMLIDAIRVLGEETYELGDRKDLETHYELSNIKREKIEEIQKMFLSSFVRLGFLEEFRLFSKEEKAQLLEQRVKTLTDKGIKLRI